MDCGRPVQDREEVSGHIEERRDFGGDSRIRRDC